MMKDRTKIVIGLLALVVAVFVLWPDLLGQGRDLPTFSVAPGTNTMDVPSEIPCETVQDCIDFAAAQGDITGVKARCDTTCVYIVDIVIPEGSE